MFFAVLSDLPGKDRLVIMACVFPKTLSVQEDEDAGRADDEKAHRPGKDQGIFYLVDWKVGRKVRSDTGEESEIGRRKDYPKAKKTARPRFRFPKIFLLKKHVGQGKKSFRFSGCQNPVFSGLSYPPGRRT